MDESVSSSSSAPRSACLGDELHGKKVRLQHGSSLTATEPHIILPVALCVIDQALQQRVGRSSDLRFYGQDETFVVLVVAMVEQVLKQWATLLLSVNNGTGRIIARHFISESSSLDSIDMEVGRYVDVAGRVVAPQWATWCYQASVT